MKVYLSTNYVRNLPSKNFFDLACLKDSNKNVLGLIDFKFLRLIILYPKRTNALYE